MKTQSPEKTISFFNRQIERFEASRFGWMAIYITAQSCLGSIACFYILKSGGTTFPLALCAGITMACNGAFIAQSPARWCLIAFYLSVLINATLIAIYLFH